MVVATGYKGDKILLKMQEGVGNEDELVEFLRAFIDRLHDWDIQGVVVSVNKDGDRGTMEFGFSDLKTFSHQAWNAYSIVNNYVLEERVKK